MMPGAGGGAAVLIMLSLFFVLFVIAIKFSESLFHLVVHGEKSRLNTALWTGAVLAGVGVLIAIPEFEEWNPRRSWDDVVAVSDIDFTAADLKTQACDVAKAVAVDEDLSAVDRWYALGADAVNYEEAGWEVTRYGFEEGLRGAPYPFRRGEWFEARSGDRIVNVSAADVYRLTLCRGSCGHIGRQRARFVEIDDFGELPIEQSAQD